MPKFTVTRNYRETLVFDVEAADAEAAASSEKDSPTRFHSRETFDVEPVEAKDDRERKELMRLQAQGHGAAGQTPAEYLATLELIDKANREAGAWLSKAHAGAKIDGGTPPK